MTDQANALRGLMEHRSRRIARDWVDAADARTGEFIAIASGKGGVGKSNVALNLALALSQRNKTVAVLDVSWGTGSLELLAGVSGTGNFSQIFSEGKGVEEIIAWGPSDLAIIAGIGHVALMEPEQQHIGLRKLTAALSSYDFVIVDLAVGMARLLPELLSRVDRLICLTLAEPTSLAESYAAIKGIAGRGSMPFEVLFNQEDSSEFAEKLYRRLRQTTRAFLKADLAWSGRIPIDSHVPAAVRRRVPFLMDAPHCPASSAINELAERLIREQKSARVSPPHATYLMQKEEHHQALV